MYNSTQAKAWDSLHWADDLIGTGCKQPHILTPHFSHSDTKLFTFSHQIFHILTSHFSHSYTTFSHSHTTFFTLPHQIFQSPPSKQYIIVIFLTGILSIHILANLSCYQIPSRLKLVRDPDKDDSV